MSDAPRVQVRRFGRWGAWTVRALLAGFHAADVRPGIVKSVDSGLAARARTVTASTSTESDRAELSVTASGWLARTGTEVSAGS